MFFMTGWLAMRHFKALKKINMQTKVAWHIQGDEGQREVIVFCHYGYIARQLGAVKLAEHKSNLSVERAPEYDEFASMGEVPLLALLFGGWTFECRSCEKIIRIDFDLSNPNMFPLCEGESVYCNQNCQSSGSKRIANQKPT
jgi:hypothetical protein